MEEIFKEIEGYESKYLISNYGRIKSKNYHNTGRDEFLKIQTNRNGYQHISIWYKGETKMYSIHRLVWKTFKGEIPEGYEVNHMDENPSNNRLDNLNLLTHKENMNWGTCIERMASKLKGRKHSEETKQKMSKAGKGRYNEKNCKVVLQYDLNDNLIKEWPSGMEINRQLGFSRGSIAECCKGIRKTANGFKWKYLIIN